MSHPLYAFKTQTPPFSSDKKVTKYTSARKRFKRFPTMQFKKRLRIRKPCNRYKKISTEF